MPATPQKRRLQITPSLVISVFALIIALSSSATAALVITGKNIKKNAVASKHIKKKAVKGKHLAPGVKKKLNASGTQGEIGPVGPQGEAGSDGAQGVQGPQGPAGTAGAPGVSGYQLVSTMVAVSPESNGKALAVCPANKRVLGGGGHWQFGTAPNTSIVNSMWVSLSNSGPRQSTFIPPISGGSGTWNEVAPSGDVANSWVVSGRNGEDSDTYQLTAWAICANVT